MKKNILLTLLISVLAFTAFSQCSFEVNIISTHPKCNENNGIIHIQTNAISPSFAWSNGLTDSIRTNLAAGIYEIKVKDINGCEKIIEAQLANFTTADPRFILPDAAFSYKLENYGYVKFSNSGVGVNQQWTFGDGTAEIGMSPVHKYSSNGTFEVCHNFTNACGSDTVCKSIQVTINQKQVETGTAFLRTANFELPEGFYVNYSCECNNKLFLMGNANTQETQNLMYSLDLTTKNLIKLPVSTRRRGSVLQNFRFDKGYICKDNVLYFGGNNGVAGNELYRTDGTIAGTRMVADYSVGVPSSNPEEFFVFNNTLYYCAEESDANSSTQYTFSTDGINVTKIAYEFFGEPVVLNGKIIYKYPNGKVKASSSVGETSTILRDTEDCFACELQNLGKVNGNLLYYTSDPAHGYELWKSDGTPSGTGLLKDINPGTNRSYVSSEAMYYNGFIYFVADDGVNGMELWRSDGTETGTTIFKNINPGSASSKPGSLTVVDNLLFFNAETNTYGRELWKSDGTAEGTVMLYDGVQGSASHINYSTKKFIPDGMSFFYTDSHVGLAKANKDATTYTTMHTWGYGCLGVAPDNLFKMPDGKIYFYTLNGLGQMCTYKKPYVSDTLLSAPSDYYASSSITLKANGVPGLTYKWFVNQEPKYCSNNVKSTNQVYSFDAYLSGGAPQAYVRSFTPDGCASPADKVSLLTRREPVLDIWNIKRCDARKIVFYGRFSYGNFYSGNSFVASIQANNIVTNIPLEFDGGNMFTITLPDGIPEVINPADPDIYVNIKSTNPSKVLNSILVRSISEMKLSLYKNETINEAQNHSAFVSMGDTYVMPYSFKVNGKSYQNLLVDPFKIEISNSVSKKYVLSDFKNACSTGPIGISNATIKVNKPCVSSINHTNSVIDNNYFAQNQIVSQGKINSNGIVEYNSGKSLNLTPGFTVEKGGYFKAVISGCN